MAIPSTIVYFVSYETIRANLVDWYRASTGQTDYPAYLALIAGSIARVWSVTVVNPLELIRTKMQSRKLTFEGTNLFSVSNIYVYKTILLTKYLKFVQI